MDRNGTGATIGRRALLAGAAGAAAAGATGGARAAAATGGARAAAATGGARAATGAGGLAFVLNSDSASISLIDVATRTVIGTRPVLREPHHLALTPDGTSLIVGDTGGNRLFFFDPLTGAKQRDMVASDPYQLMFSPNGRLLTLAGLARNQIDIYDAHSMTLTHRVPARSMPSHINYAPDGSTVFVSLQGTDELIAIDTASGGVRWKRKVGKTPAGVLWHNGSILVGCMGTDYVAVVDPADGHVSRRIVTGTGAHNIFVSHDRTTMVVSDRVAGMLSFLDPASLDVIRSIHVPGGPDDLDWAPDGKIWATLRWRQHVAVIDPATGTYDAILVGRSPHGIWLNTHMPAAKVASRG